MFIYNVTVSVEKEVEQDWLNWMQEVHIPDVMKSDCFTGNRILKVFSAEDEGPVYSVQYMFSTIADIEKYQAEFAQRLQEDHRSKFGTKTVAFRTLLQVVA